MEAQEIKSIVARVFTDKLWAVHFEVGLCKGGRLRADVLATNLKKQVVIIETKSSVQDFKTDKKWSAYLEFSTQFYWAMTVSTYSKVKHLIPKSTGVFVIDDETGRIRLVGRSAKRPISPEVHVNLLARMAYRSADATRYERKSKTAGSKLVAEAAVDAIYNHSLPTRKVAVSLVVKAIKKYV